MVKGSPVANGQQEPFSLSPEHVATGLRVFRDICRCWSAAEDEQVKLLGLAGAAELRELLDSGGRGTGEAPLLRISLVFRIFRAINTLLPEAARADAWMRAPSTAPLFAGRTAMEVMTSTSEGLGQVCEYVEAELF